jgi:serine/threonine-protein kinase
MSSEPTSRESARSSGKVVQLGKYKVVAHIATGGMGTVYRALDTESGQEVALKVINARQAARSDALQRFHREAHNAAQLRHENIVTVYEVGEYKDIIYLAMEFIDGIDLHDHITRKGQLDVEEARLITFQAARALHHAHKRGVIHRDIKPSNFLLTRQNGRLIVKLTDLGLSRKTSDEEFRVTREGFTVGTIDYISPEQARDSASADIRSDIYSLGCSLYHMLTGQPPFPEGGLAERIYKHMEVPPADVRDVRPDVPAGMWSVLKKMLAKKPEDRFQTPKELLSALGRLEDPQFVAGEETTEARTKPPPTEEIEIKGPRLKRSEGSSSSVEVPVPARAAPVPRIKEEAPAPRVEKKTESPRPRRKKKKARKRSSLLTAGIGVGVLAVVLLVVLLKRGGGNDGSDDTSDDRKLRPKPPITDPNPIVEGPKDSKDSKDSKVPIKPPETTWPPLREGALFDKQELTRVFSTGWEEQPLPAEVPVFRVRRQPRETGQYASLGEAIKAVQSRGGVGLPGARLGYDAIIEIQDNGPLYETASGFTGKNVLIRAAPTFRPLICWELDRQPVKPLPPFLAVQDGNLTLEGLEIVLAGFRPASDGKTTFVRVQSGDFLARACTFSSAGTHPKGVVLARLEGKKAGERPNRCRLSRCQVRGALTALDVDLGMREILLDDSLLVGAESPLLDIRLKSGDRGKVQLLRSTLVGRRNCIRVTGDDSTVAPDTLRFLAWDALLARTGPGRTGALLELPAMLRAEAVRWQGFNCLYPGWAFLMRGPKDIEGIDEMSWERYWTSKSVERADLAAWPAASFSEPGEVAALQYTTRKMPGEPVGYASTSWPCLAAMKEPVPPTLGCPVELLPAARDLWLQWTAQRYAMPGVEMLTNSSAPEIPVGGTAYHGGRVDLTKEDLGALLDREQQGRGLGPRVVLHLCCSGTGKPKPSSPIHVKNTELVLFFEPGKRLPMGMEMAEPERTVLSIQGESVRSQAAFIEVENGSLEMIGGDIRSPDYRQAALPPYLLRVSGGTLRLHDMRLRGPQFDPPDGFDGLIQFIGSEKSPGLALHDTLLLSARNAIRVQGRGARVRLAQCVVVAGTDAIDLDAGAGKNSRRDLTCRLENTTIAAGRSIVHVGAIPNATPEEPIVVQTRSSALLNPFPSKAGVLLFEGDALHRGVLLWQGEGDAFDKRFHFGAAQLGAIPEKAESFADWVQVWGPGVGQRVLGNFPQGPRFEKDRWPLERLVLTPTGPGSSSIDPRGIGADLQRLGLLRKSRPR